MDDMKDTNEMKASRAEEQQDIRRDQDDRNGPRKGKGFFRKKVCRFCTQKVKIDYKDADLLRRYTTERGKILPFNGKPQLVAIVLRRLSRSRWGHTGSLSLGMHRNRLKNLPFTIGG